MERTQAKEAQRAKEQQTKNASLVLGRISSSIVALRAVMENQNFAFLAPMIKRPVEEGWTRLQTLDSDATRVIENGEGEVEDAKAIAAEVAVLRKHMVLASSILATMAKVQP